MTNGRKRCEMCVIAKDCEFAEEDNMMRDKIVFGVFNKRVQECMLRNSNLSLEDAIDLFPAAELSQCQLADIRKQEEIGSHKMKKKKAGNCTVYGESGLSAQECPTRKSMQSQCFRCKGYGHISSVCPSGNTKVHYIQLFKVHRNKLNVEGEREGAVDVDEVEIVSYMK